ncbi:omega-hydroxypalmitate O-feruloyl transferase-like protein [Cinnamomum micranthum f. kanehirae]|uniref:Omega-hydroxypalmitate O-feruloyl transferase-like protein n=1 Tax=Cinnamomum micranthum f. kanehirae TaxID=337451 RepID=A0A443P0P0_9MAGN|nr:omega-hydroxypalmitate O-feruloyl transferase-like protein [Cinnamomum micranthum f. kanehirae]
MEAYADVELRELQPYNPDASVAGKLLPKKKDGVLCIQVTELKCGINDDSCKSMFGKKVRIREKKKNK